MKGRNIITINGRAYDAISGMPIQTDVASKPTNQPQHTQHQPAQPKHRAFSDIAPQPAAHNVHRQLQKSQTLHRKPLKKPEPIIKAGSAGTPAYRRSPAISRFNSIPATQPVPVEAAPQPVPAPEELKPPTMHPKVARAIAQSAPVAVESPQDSRKLKEMLIQERLDEVDMQQKPKKERRKLFASQPRLASILSSTLALLLLAGYLTYINLPNISMRVAATRAGIAANFPSYNPDGYSFSGPITYAPGEVAINFKSNTNDNSFTVKQKSSNWDSQAVLDNYVTKQTDTYLTYQERGLTIYSFENKAAWVNGGLLYSIEGNAPLSAEQILRIATSM